MMNKASADYERGARKAFAEDDSEELSDTSVNRLLEPTETQAPLRGAVGIANGVAASLVIWLTIGAIALITALLIR